MSRVDSLVHQHPHMHQQDQQRAFTSTLHHPSPILPAAVTRAQDRNVNTHPPRGSGACFSALRPLQSTTQRSSRPVKMQQKSKHLGLLGPVQPKESQQPSCKHPDLDSPRGLWAYENIDGSCETGNMAVSITPNRSGPSYLHPCCVTPLEGVPQPGRPLWEEKPVKEEHTGSQTDTRKHLPLRGNSWDAEMIPELKGRSRGSLDRKRQLERENFIKVKRMKKETEDSWSGSSATLHSDSSSVTALAHPFLHTAQVQHISSLCVLYPNGCKCLISYPGTELHPYSWEPTWSNRGEFLGTFCPRSNNYMNTFNGFFPAPLYLPISPEQETLYLRERDILCHFNNHCYDNWMSSVARFKNKHNRTAPPRTTVTDSW
ncbi:uncharacterized protein LOC133441835 isoform X2 [Cololabis saira]|uniref:uncharacterized protein LOC133441835 isoform X2 n=1 Tax=Cololabis saira TaxID=129043 RepID=UPI002AD257D8|nr:uncharacterized protein LOC133441835 isoform X2 [Cololabis saira]